MVLKDPFDMKHIIAAACLLVLGFSPIFSVPGDVVYTEGDAIIKYKTGEELEAYIGDIVDTGDTVKTGSDGFVELDRQGIVIKINSDTVFTMLGREENREKMDVFSVVLGSIRFRYDKITGKEPKIQTGSCIAGVRGTEFEVFSALDGSTLIVVENGLIAVESEGKTVELNPEEGVEVRPGEAPGEKFKVLIGKIDYSKWNEEKLEGLLDDPVKAIERTRKRLDSYKKEIEEIYPLFLEKRDILKMERAKNRTINETQGKEASQKYYNEIIFPLEIETSNLVLNYRYWALSALSLRRFVMGRMYLILKSRYIADLNNSTYVSFLRLHEQILASFEKSIVPHLVEFDI